MALNNSRPILEVGSHAVLWSDGQLTAGLAMEPKQASAAVDNLQHIARHGGGWIACGLGGLKSNYAIGDHGSLVCEAVTPGQNPTRWTLEPGDFHTGVTDLSIEGSRATALYYQSARVRLSEIVFDAETGKRLGSRELPERRDVAPPMLLSNGVTARLVHDATGCSLVVEGATLQSPAKVSPQEQFSACQFYDTRLLADTSTGRKAWLLRATGVALLAEVRSSGSASPTLVTTPLPSDIAQKNSDPVLLLDGKVYYAQQPTAGEDIVVNVWDTKQLTSRRQVIPKAPEHRRPLLEDLVPSFSQGERGKALVIMRDRTRSAALVD